MARHAEDRVSHAQRHLQPLQGDPVPTRGVVGLSDADRQGHGQLVDDGVVAFVVAAQPAGDPGHEAVVQRPAGRRSPLLQLVQAHRDRVQDPSRPTLGHDRREHRRERAHRAPDGAGRLDHVAAGAQRVAHGMDGDARGALGRVDDPVAQPGGAVGQHFGGEAAARDKLTGRRRGQRVIDRVLGLHVEEGQRELDTPDPVGQGVVHLHDERGGTVLQPAHQRELPQRAGVVEAAHGRQRGETEHLVPAVRGRGVDPAQVPGDVEVGVRGPARRGQAGGALDQALPEARDLAGGPLEPLHEVLPAGGLAEPGDADHGRTQ